MGTVFELIADNALVAEDPDYYVECHVCGRIGISVYRCTGYLVRDGAGDLADDRYVACEACLKLGSIAHRDEYLTDPLIDRFASKPAESKALLRRTPRIPLFMQGDDWPLCCGELTEFTGSPDSLEVLIAAQLSGFFWDRGPEPGSYDARDDGPPESFREVSLFRCKSCGAGFWTFQPT